MNRKIVDAFAIAGAVATLVGVIVAGYVGWRQLTDPGTVVQGIDRLVENSERQIEVSQDIRNALTPADAFEALAKRGYKVDRQHFRQAFAVGDERAIDLFCQAATTPIVDSYFFFKDFDLPDDAGSRFAECSAIDLKKICSFPTTYHQFSDAPIFIYEPDVAVPLCGEAAFRAAVQQHADRTVAYEAELKIKCQEMSERLRRKSEQGQLGLYNARSDYDVAVVANRYSGFFTKCGNLGAPIVKP